MSKKGLILIFALLLTVGIIGCNRIGPSTTTPPIMIPPPITTPTFSECIYVNADCNKSSYLPEEEITAVVTFTNITDMPYTISPFPPPIEIKSGDNNTVHTFPAGSSTTTVQQGETIEHMLVWDQRDEQGKPVHYGQYRFFIPYYVRIYSSLGSTYILPEKGVIEKTIQLDKSQTVNGTTFTLKRVDLKPMCIRFWAINEGCYRHISAYAEYRIDNSPVIEHGKVNAIGSGTGVNGMQYMWTMYIPVPKSAQDLYFTITRLDDTEGPWEFKVPLK